MMINAVLRMFMEISWESLYGKQFEVWFEGGRAGIFFPLINVHFTN